MANLELAINHANERIMTATEPFEIGINLKQKKKAD